MRRTFVYYAIVAVAAAVVLLVPIVPLPLFCYSVASDNEMSPSIWLPRVVSLVNYAMFVANDERFVDSVTFVDEDGNRVSATTICELGDRGS